MSQPPIKKIYYTFKRKVMLVQDYIGGLELRQIILATAFHTGQANWPTASIYGNSVEP